MKIFQVKDCINRIRFDIGNGSIINASIQFVSTNKGKREKNTIIDSNNWNKEEDE